MRQNLSLNFLVGPIGRRIPLIVVVLLFIGNYTKSIWLLIGVTLLFFLVAVTKLVKTKALLKKSIDYCRVVASGPHVILEFFMLALILVFYLIWLPDRFQLNEVSMSFFTGNAIPMGIGNYYNKFSYSISAYEDGIRLPNKLHQTIYWPDIQDIRHEKNFVTIQFNNGSIKTWEIDAADYKSYKTISSKFSGYTSSSRPI